jgi:hypothetical protein
MEALQRPREGQTFAKISTNKPIAAQRIIADHLPMIHALLDATQVLTTIEIESIPHEVCVEALANHDRRTNLLTVNLRAFLRSEQQDHIGEQSTAAWLPEPETIIEHVEAGEAHAVASDVFASWKRKVEAVMPR